MSLIQSWTVAALAVAGVLLLIGSTESGDVQHERYVIHVPIKYHTIHHVNVKKVPVYVKKHIHHHKYQEEHVGEEHHQPQVNQHQEQFPYDRYDDDDEYTEGGAYNGGSYENSDEYYR